MSANSIRLVVVAAYVGMFAAFVLPILSAIPAVR